MKKFLTLMMLFAMSLALVSCGGETKSPVERYEAVVMEMERALEKRDGEALEKAFMKLEGLVEEFREEGVDEAAMSQEEQAKLAELGERVFLILAAGAGLAN